MATVQRRLVCGPQSKESGGLYRFPLIPVHGVPLMKPIVDDWKRVEKFQARPDDILISTYPKAGTTWIQEIVDCIMNDGKLEKTSRAPTHVRSPFMELSLPSPFPCGIDDLEKTPSPRLVKTHLPYELVPKSLWEQKCKTIYVARNAKDNLVSYFFFSKMCTILPDPGTLDQYLESFLKGDVPWGSWFDHVIGWWNARDKQVILYLFYEDMKENPKQEIQKVIKFLEKNLSDEVVENICQHTSFKAMKENPMANQTSFPVFDHKVSPFMRKGTSYAQLSKTSSPLVDTRLQQAYSLPLAARVLSYSTSSKGFLSLLFHSSKVTFNNVPEAVCYRYPLHLVNGVPLMKPIVDDWERVETFQAKPDDILIATYPKAGTTWMQEIVDSIMNNGELEKNQRGPTHERSPFLEYSLPPIPSGVDLLNVTPSPRLVKTHLPYKLVPKSFWEQKCKAIYVARNAKDNMVSYYFFELMCKTHPDPGTWEQYVEKFLKGDMAWGSWFDHVIGWWNAKDRHNILYVFYEDMKEDPQREIRKVMKFLGKNLSDETLEKIYRHTSFTAMKENPMANYTSVSGHIMDQNLSPFMRKGQVADWKNYFTESQNKHFDEEYEKKMRGTDLKFRESRQLLEGWEKFRVTKYREQGGLRGGKVSFHPICLPYFEGVIQDGVVNIADSHNKFTIPIGEQLVTFINVPEEVCYRYPLHLVNGVPLMKPIVDDWERVETFQAKPDDILIATYPKAGTTWMQEIVDSIMNNGELEKNQRGPTHERSPFLELSLPPIPSGIDLLNVTPSPRLVKTHLPYKLVPKSLWEKKCKAIYVARNAKDNMVSYYFFELMCKTQPDPGTWEQYVEKFLKGDMAWGSWFDHVIGWWNAKDRHNILYMFYEDMKEDPQREIRKVMNFLGKNLSDETLEKIYRHTSFTSMKENPMANYSCFSGNLMDQNLSPFMRKGQVADWMNYFTESQNKHFDEEYEKKMRGTDLKFRTHI
ncbi:uncharacterized protein PAF06_013933 [Gastrophryne carolinensis]